jgi:WD40 repeat protein
VQLRDSGTGQRLRALSGLSGWVRALAFSADDTRLAGGDVDGTINVWGAATGRELEKLSTSRFSCEKEQSIQAIDSEADPPLGRPTSYRLPEEESYSPPCSRRALIAASLT